MAKGSHATYGGWEQRTCHICGEKVVLSKPDKGLWFYYDDTTNTAYTWHTACLRNQRAKEKP